MQKAAVIADISVLFIPKFWTVGNVLFSLCSKHRSYSKVQLSLADSRVLLTLSVEFYEQSLIIEFYLHSLKVEFYEH